MKQTLSAFLVIAFFIASTVVVYAGGINSGKPVPYITNTIESAEFLVDLIEKDYGGDEEDWLGYAKGLARTLSQLSSAEQQEVWHGP